MLEYQIPGLSLAIVKDGEIIKSNGYGVANFEFDIPADENTIYQLYSASKVFAGVAVMKLVEDGKPTLDTSITEILKNSPSGLKKFALGIF